MKVDDFSSTREKIHGPASPNCFFKLGPRFEIGQWSWVGPKFQNVCCFWSDWVQITNFFSARGFIFARNKFILENHVTGPQLW